MTFRFFLIRDVLSHVDQHQRDAWIDMWIETYDDETVSDCVTLLQQRGYVEVVSVSTPRGEVWKSIKLTEKGAAFLDKSRDSAAWNRALEAASEKGDGCELEDFQTFLDLPE